MTDQSESAELEAAPQVGGSAGMALLARKRSQVLDQYIAVAHLAEAIAGLAKDNVTILKHGDVFMSSTSLDIKGKTTAEWMDSLGDMLNSVDAVDPEYKWMNPIIKATQKMFPVSR